MFKHDFWVIFFYIYKLSCNVAQTAKTSTKYKKRKLLMNEKCNAGIRSKQPRKQIITALIKSVN